MKARKNLVSPFQYRKNCEYFITPQAGCFCKPRNRITVGQYKTQDIFSIPSVGVVMLIFMMYSKMNGKDAFDRNSGSDAVTLKLTDSLQSIPQTPDEGVCSQEKQKLLQ
uniref:Transmembrane protein n=1 Tax=Bursaphelenchus xylophilus TaxID=6326 RepID=A0A1I7SCZ3_BURXY